MSVCLSVRSSRASIVSKKLDESSRLLARRLPYTYPTLCCKEIWVSPKITELFSGTLYKIPDSENFVKASRSRCQQNSLSSSSTVELADEIYTTIDESWLFTTSRPTATLNSITSICCGFVVQLVSTVDSILTDLARRAVHLR